MAKKYRINPDKIDYIISKYGTMENFIKAYRENGVPEFEKDGPLGSNIKPNLCINISKETQNEHLSELYQVIYNSVPNNSTNKGNLVLFDGGKFMERLSTLTEKEKDIICYRFGIVDGRFHTLDEIGKIFGVHRERIRQIENKAIRKLQKTLKEKIYDEKEFEREALTPEEEVRRDALLDKIYKSNLIFVPDEEYTQEPDSITPEELRETALELSDIQRSSLPPTTKETPIEELELSTRAYRALARADITTIEQLKTKNLEELKGIRNMGARTLQEIREKLNSLELVEHTEEPQVATTKDSQSTSSNEMTELENARAIRDELTREAENLKQRTQSAKELLASYDKLLGITQNGNETQEPRGE